MNGRKNRDMISQKRKIGTIRRLGGGAFSQENGEGKAVQLVEKMIAYARKSHASDIHIEPFDDMVRIRMRMDGSLTEYARLEKGLHPAVTARVKILAGMDIAEHRIPQDGHFQIELEGCLINMRVSAVPTVFGEKVVIRLLTSENTIDHADTFGREEQNYQVIRHLLDAPNGLLYLTGPTGSGKTTTLYMILEFLAGRPVNIATIEDPVEKYLPGVCQCQVNYPAGFGFETGLRALLRQDPDIIMVGETRDRETAAISMRAAITGHLVLSTLHTNDAVAAIPRLRDIGMESYQIAGALLGIAAQRLLRKLCPFCAREEETTKEERRILGAGTVKIRRPVGCPRCSDTGYRGRTAIHQILPMDRNLRAMISRDAGEEEIRKYAEEELGMPSLKEQAAKLVREGITSFEEYRNAVYHE